MNTPHQFHIPVMGTGHSIDTPIRVAHLGISSVISIVDDQLCEKIRKYYCQIFELPYRNIPVSEPDGRALRITAYLDTVAEIVSRKFEQIKALPFLADTEKDRYFRMLPDVSPLRMMYERLKSTDSEEERQLLEEKLTASMSAGSIDVNIMSKVDALRLDRNGVQLSAEFSDACAALRGFANSVLESSVVFSAGFNPRLYNYITEFKDFYRDQSGKLRKKIILKVSDFRSALVQGKFMANKGIEVSEFRIESGLNCGGHAFATDGLLLPVLLKEFHEKRSTFSETFLPMIRKYYDQQEMILPDSAEDGAFSAKVTVQGGIGVNGEMKRMQEVYNMDACGWGSPFLLVPEATCVDTETMSLLASATEKDLYLSGVSPLGVPFNNVRNSGSDKYTKELIEQGKPGSKCPKGFLVSNTEFTEEAICTASAEYQVLKIRSIEESDLSDVEKAKQTGRALEKTCLCTNLGTSALIRLGILKPEYGRQEVCPGPNVAWFTREYTLDEMVNHIYGRTSLVVEERPHMFAKELAMYVDYLENLVVLADGDEQETKKLVRFRDNLLKGMDLCLEIATGPAWEGENMASIVKQVEFAHIRLDRLFATAQMA
jgi:hypothetical protein